MKQYYWHNALHECETRAKGYVLITVLAQTGSTPRENGCKMVVTDDSQFDTIGGGHLEFAAIKQARALLAKNQDAQHIESFMLSSKLGQCCGGTVEVLFEVRCQHVQHVALFGAGHVAQSLVSIISQLPIQVKWYDSRQEYTPKELPSNVQFCCDDTPVGELRHLPDNSWIIVMTHDHQLDFALVEAALKQQRFEYVGMIGSNTKAKRFTYRLQQKGISDEQLANFVTPIGDLTIPGKRPVEVAVSVSAQLIRALNVDQTSTSSTRPFSFTDILSTPETL